MIDSQIHKRINFNFDKQKLIFDTSMELFSFAKIDDGTKELLNSLRKNSKLDYSRILDLGCGYGVVGIYLKSKFPFSNITSLDKNSLAIDFTAHNAKLNSLKINTISSLDFENIDDKFSLIVTNFPAKLEKNGLEYFISKSSKYLEKNGILAVVIVSELNDSIKEILEDENIEIQFKSFSKKYCVYHLKFKNEIKPNSNPYSISDKIFIFPEIKINILTSNALQEFDTSHFITELIVERIIDKSLDKYKQVTIINPNQGIIPVVIARHPRDKIILTSKDLLQLKLSSENLRRNGIEYFETINSDFSQNAGDLLIWSLRDEDDKTIIEKLKTYRKNFDKIILGGRISVINRIIKRENIKIKHKNTRGKYIILEI